MQGTKQALKIDIKMTADVANSNSNGSTYASHFAGKTASSRQDGR